MSAPELLDSLAGHWKGSSTLALPDRVPPESVSDSTATIAPVARGKFGRIEYTWSHEGSPHEGVLLVGREQRRNAAQVVWIDSWHQSETFLLSDGTLDSSGSIDVLGHYPAPTGPDWGWRTSIRPTPDGWELVMFNISPEGDEALAFHNVYTRA